jgi:DNA ligase D-like protein (predicted 3'-phosphoesterase)
MALKTYRQKRDFSKTNEPKGMKPVRVMKAIFVIQKHYASHLHYDFRLEVDGVLKSWALPKGMPEKPKEKRLAIETEDHPIEYAKFEGTIPEGEYGAGKVEIWDKGTFQNTTEDGDKPVSARQALKKGHMNFSLDGNRVKGRFTLLVFKELKGGHKQWLLMKRDE